MTQFFLNSNKSSGETGWSRGEISDLTLKAARGAGLTWGLAEEASEAVIWLQARGFPGLAAFCCYISWYRFQKLEYTGMPGISEKGSPLCPFATGAAISDGVIKLPIDNTKMSLGLIRQPILLLPFISRVRPHGIGLYAGNFLMTSYLQRDISIKRFFFSPSLINEAECYVKNSPLALKAEKFDESQSLRLPECYKACIDVLTKSAQRIYAPSTDYSRKLGAGSTISDDD
tara:strand:- start:129 stop:818 length:690 start_codon:yes stop_codon:yes gene_type:complete